LAFSKATFLFLEFFKISLKSIPFKAQNITYWAILCLFALAFLYLKISIII